MFTVNSKKIRRLIFDRQFSVKKLAEKAQLQKSSVARLLIDGAKVKPETVGKLARALGVSGDELILD